MPIALSTLLLAAIFGGIIGYLMKSHQTFGQILRNIGMAAFFLYGLYIICTIAAWASTYHWIYSTVENAGWTVDTYLLKATVGFLTAVGSLLIPQVVMSLLSFKHRQAVLSFTAIYCGMCVVLYFMARPAEGQLANMKTGAALMNCYKGADNLVEIYPEAIRFHPRYPGTPLQTCTADLIKEYEKQQKSLKDGKPLVWIPIKRGQDYVTARYGKLNMWLEGLQANDRMTLVHLACAGQTGGGFNGEGLLRPQGDTTYLTDQLGNVYRILEDKAQYPSHTVKEGDTEKTVLDDKEILPGQVYRFTLVFPPLGPETKFISLFHFQMPVALGATLNPPPDHNAEMDKVMGTAPIEWFKFRSEPNEVVSSSQVGGESGTGIKLRVEQVGINSQGTILTLVASLSEHGEKRLYSAKAGSDTFVQDDKDRKYSLIEDLGEYKQEDGQPPFHQFSSWYRFSLVFKPLVGKVSKIKFSHWQFEPLELALGLPDEKPVTTSPAVSEQPLREGQEEQKEAEESTISIVPPPVEPPKVNFSQVRKVAGSGKSEPVRTEPVRIKSLYPSGWEISFKADSRFYPVAGLPLSPKNLLVVKALTPTVRTPGHYPDAVYIKIGNGSRHPISVQGTEEYFRIDESQPTLWLMGQRAASDWPDEFVVYVGYQR